VLSGEITGANIVKLGRDEPKVSYLSYPGFDVEAHPALEFSIRVDLRSFNIKNRDFRGSENRPILHRKELFVPHDYPGREAFEKARPRRSDYNLNTQSKGLNINAKLAALQNCTSAR
jgi:DNA phosphorothioation-associated putative methyltransferase